MLGEAQGCQTYFLDDASNNLDTLSRINSFYNTKVNVGIYKRSKSMVNFHKLKSASCQKWVKMIWKHEKELSSQIKEFTFWHFDKPTPLSLLSPYKTVHYPQVQ